MNKERRKQLGRIYDSLTDLKDELEATKEEEQEYADNMPDNLQSSEKHERAEEVVSFLDDAISDIESALENIDQSKE